MKIVYLLVILVVTHIPLYSKIGMNNFMVSVGGGYQGGFISGHKISSDQGFYTESPAYFMQGGSFSAELGYILSGVTKKLGVVNTLDIRGNFSMSWLKGNVAQNSLGQVEQQSQSIGGGVMLVYGLGFAIGKPSKDARRVVFDFLGGGYSWNAVMSTRKLHSSTENSSDVVTVEYILPGAYYMDRSGFMIGVRNTLKLALTDELIHPSISYNMNAYIGFAFGK